MDQLAAAVRAPVGLCPAARGELAGTELARARRAYHGALEAMRAWSAFSPHSRHHGMSYWSLLASLFAEPGLNRTRLSDRIVEYARVSRSTAQRTIRDARHSGHIVDQPSGKAVRYFLAEQMVDHCVLYFRNWLDQEQVEKALGYH
jgi:hypothetical protein